MRPFFPLQSLCTHLCFQERNHKTRHRNRDIALLAHQMDRGKLGLGLLRKVGFDPRAQRFPGKIDIQDPDDRNSRPGDHAVPMPAGPIVRRSQTGFLLDLASDTAGDVDRAAADVVEVGRSRWEIDAAGIRGMLAHFAKEKNAIGATQRPHAEAVEYRWVRKAPVAPCQEAREIGIEIAGAEALCGEYGIAPEQDAAVPDRLLALFGSEMRCDLGAPLVGERPTPSLEGEVERPDAMNDRKRD